jgi:hypothetical protein
MTAADGGAAGIPIITPESACLWSGCGKLFGRLEELVQHIHKGQKSIHMPSVTPYIDYNIIPRACWDL